MWNIVENIIQIIKRNFENIFVNEKKIKVDVSEGAINYKFI